MVGYAIKKTKNTSESYQASQSVVSPCVVSPSTPLDRARACIFNIDFELSLAWLFDITHIMGASCISRCAFAEHDTLKLISYPTPYIISIGHAFES